MKNLLRLGIVGLVMVMMFATNGATPAHAAVTFLVNQTADLADGNLADNHCDTNTSQSGDQCSLRAAIQQSNATSGTDTINFVSTAAHGLSRTGNDNTALNGDLDITDSVIINGHSPATSIDGNGIDRVFQVHSGTVTMQDLIVFDGSTSGFGGGYEVEANANVTLTNVVVRNNFAADNSGGIENFGALTLNQVTITDNETNDFIGGIGSGRSGTSASLTIRDSTINDNEGLQADIGGNNNTIINSTLTALTATGLASLRNATVNSLGTCDPNGCGNSNAVNLFNTIVGDCVAQTDGDPTTVSSLGYNLIGQLGTCVVTGNQAGNLLNVNPQLRRLADNGGPTLTRALAPSSPAIDGGNPSGCVFGNNQALTTDQRGFTRPTDGNGDGTVRCDIGAFEVQP